MSAFARGQKATPSDDSAYDFDALMHRLYAAWSDLDPAKAAPFYAKDADLVDFDIAPLEYNGWNQVAEGVKKAFAAYSSGQFILNNDVRTHHQGNLAWGTATWHAELVKKDGGKQHLEGRYTVVWEKRNGEWLIVHEHQSLPAALAPAQQ